MPGTQAEAEKKGNLCLSLGAETEHILLDMGGGMERRQAQAVLPEPDFTSAGGAPAPLLTVQGLELYKRTAQSISVFLFLGETG